MRAVIVRVMTFVARFGTSPSRRSTPRSGSPFRTPRRIDHDDPRRPLRLGMERQCGQHGCEQTHPLGDKADLAVAFRGPQPAKSTSRNRTRRERRQCDDVGRDRDILPVESQPQLEGQEHEIAGHQFDEGMTESTRKRSGVHGDAADARDEVDAIEVGRAARISRPARQCLPLPKFLACCRFPRGWRVFTGRRSSPTGTAGGLLRRGSRAGRMAKTPRDGDHAATAWLGRSWVISPSRNTQSDRFGLSIDSTSPFRKSSQC